MKVYELIQELAEFNANDQVELSVEMDTNGVFDIIQENKEFNVERTSLNGAILSIDRIYMGAVINVDAY